jgi:hypothetical protein
MPFSMHALVVDSFAPMLGTLTHLMTKARDHAVSKGVDVATLVEARLAPDMYPFRTQVQIACFHSHNTLALLAGREGPAIDNPQETIDELERRVVRTIELVKGTSESALLGSEERRVAIPLPPAVAGEGMEFQMSGLQFVRDWSFPHFYFHVTTAYDILRNAGVQIGKRDYVRHMGGYIKKRGL